MMALNGVLVLGEVSSALLVIAGVVLFILLVPMALGMVLIRETQVGIVVKKFGTLKLPPGRLIALDGEAGYQAETLPPGLHFGYWAWQYRVIKVPVTIVPQGEIALVVAADGAAIPSERILGKVVDCDTFQDARKFLLNGGEKGRQLGIITAGTYRINTALFTVIVSWDAEQHGMAAGQLHLHRVQSDQVGIVTTLDGSLSKRAKLLAQSCPPTTISRMPRRSSTAADDAACKSKSC